jgi:hypothetical protein
MVVQAEMDVEGDSVIDLNPTSMTFAHTYETPGVYYPTITLTDELGNTYTASAAIVVFDPEGLDALLRAKWNGMRTALSNGDIGKARAYIAEHTREMYEYNFNLMSSYLPDISAGLQDIQLVEIRGKYGEAEYEMWAEQDGQTYSFYILFVRDADGIWRIEFF